MILAMALVLCGIIIMAYAVYICVGLINSVKNKRYRVQWTAVLAFICLFLVGYIIYFYLTFISESNLLLNHWTVCIIFFFGAVFVVTLLRISYGLIVELEKRAEKLEELNRSCGINTIELEKRKKELLAKNKELEKALESFYLVRTSFQKDLEAGTLEQENKKIKKRLDTIKNKY